MVLLYLGGKLSLTGLYIGSVFHSVVHNPRESAVPLHVQLVHNLNMEEVWRKHVPLLFLELRKVDKATPVIILQMAGGLR
jgi:hypothetical protein